MARVLLVTTAEKGHLNPMVGLAQWLRRDGHATGWLCIPEPAPQLGEVGVEVVEPPQPFPRPQLVTGGAELAALVRDAPRLRAWIRTLLVDAVPSQIDLVRGAYRAFHPDVVALDPMLYQAVIAAHHEGIPWAGISSSLNPVTPDDLDSDLLRNVAALAEARRSLFEDHGLAPEFRVCDCLSPHLNVVYTTPEYAGWAPLPPRTHLVGAAIPPERRGDETPFPWERREPGRPLVYASFGSQISWQPEIFRLVAEACRELGAQVVMSAGSLAAELDGGDVVALPYVPQLEILSRAGAFVTHGGANSVMEAHWSGVPMLMSPVCNDQPHQAHFLARSGAGVVLDLSRARVDACRDALARLLDPEGGVRASLAPIAASYRARDGAREAARLVADLAG